MMSIEEILMHEPRGVLSLTGGGGKTSLMFHLARQLCRSGQRVLTTTTTRIFVPTAEQSETVLVDADPAMILRQASACRCSGPVTAAAQLAGAGKLKGFAPETIRLFEESGLFDWILVEADGSARRPLKAPAEHEPVIPDNTTVLVAVAGLEVLGKPLTEELVFRAELAGKIMLLSAGETITESALARLFAHPLGPFKGAPPRARRFIFLNKADDPGRREGGARIAEILRLMPSRTAEALIIGQALDGVRVHSVHHLAGDLRGARQ
ncbi:MAG: putative selenium-dependent hydroxylase accessory protein YqeC [Deltaproteobacteria bacterium]|nr:putative selenium-dependent hydroxylase accessory protein YqeC [Deltaproteobacteria bacterium]